MLVGDTVRVPLVAFVPVQPPEAVHEVALVEDQVTSETLPEVMLAGLAENDTVGAGVGEGADDAFAELDVAKSKSILATTGGLSIGAFSGSSSSVLFPETRSVTGTSSDNDRLAERRSGNGIYRCDVSCRKSTISPGTAVEPIADSPIRTRRMRNALKKAFSVSVAEVTPEVLTF